jgi:hypothetical protein
VRPHASLRLPRAAACAGIDFGLTTRIVNLVKRQNDMVAVMENAAVPTSSTYHQKVAGCCAVGASARQQSTTPLNDRTRV